MRVAAYNYLLNIHGAMTSENHPKFIVEMKRLERIWKKDKSKFQEEIFNEIQQGRN